MIRNLVTSTLAAAFLALALGGCDLCCGGSAETAAPAADSKAASLDGPAVCPVAASAAHGDIAADAMGGGTPACCPMDGACPSETADDCSECTLPQDCGDCDEIAECDEAGDCSDCEKQSECGDCPKQKECSDGKCDLPAKPQD